LVQATTANTARDGSGTLATVTTGVAAGAVIEEVTVVAIATTALGMVRFFLSTDNGATKRLIFELRVPVITVGTSTPAFTSHVDALVGLVLTGTTSILYASTNNTETFNILVQKSSL
jgi:uridylate kinase